MVDNIIGNIGKGLYESSKITKNAHYNSVKEEMCDKSLTLTLHLWAKKNFSNFFKKNFHANFTLYFIQLCYFTRETYKLQNQKPFQAY